MLPIAAGTPVANEMPAPSKDVLSVAETERELEKTESFPKLFPAEDEALSELSEKGGS